MTAGFPLHEKTLAWALNEERNHVQEVPLGSNRGPRVEHYQTFDWIPGGGYAWCIDFIQAAWAEGAGHKLPWATAGAYDLLARALTLGWVVPIKDAIPGDPLVWHFGSGHGSILRELYHDGAGLVRSVDGNVSDRVMLCERPAAWLGGAIHVPEQHTVAPVKPPATNTVTSSSGSVTTISLKGKQTQVKPPLPPPERPDEQARAYWLWLRWFLGEGEFKPYGGRSAPHRPKSLPARIPPAWWTKAREFEAARKRAGS